MHVTIDFETYSEAGFVYNKTTRKWEGLLNASKKGISQVGAAVYAKHPSTLQRLAEGGEINEI